MYIYYYFFILLFLLSLLDVVKFSHKKSVYVVVLFLTCLFYGGRSDCENDYWNYVQMYEDVPILVDTSFTDLLLNYALIQVEYGFLFVCSLLKTIGLPYQSIFFVSAFITFYFTGKTIWRVSNFPFLSFFIFNAQFFEQPFMQMRFGIAISLVFYAGYCLFVGKVKKYFLFVFLACSFQFVGIVGLALFPFYKLRLSKVQVLLCLLLSICLLFIPLSGILYAIIDGLGFSRYFIYFSEENSRLITVFLLIMILLPYIYYRNSIIRYSSYYDLILLFALCAVIFCPLSKDLSILSRFYILYSVSYCMIIPFYLHFLKRSVFSYSLFYLFLLLYTIQKFSVSLTYVTPYQFCL